MTEKIKNIVSDQINKLTNCLDALEKNGLEIKTIDIDSTFLDKIYREEPKFSKCEKFKVLYDNLPKNKPVLYWFTFDMEKLNNDNLEQVFKNIHEKIGNRKISEIPKTQREFSETLYVGKVKDKFHYRFVNHLGHSVNDKTGSLQLSYWFDALNYGNLKLNYIVLEKEMKTLIGVLEIELAQKLKPILGSHKN